MSDRTDIAGWVERLRDQAVGEDTVPKVSADELLELRRDIREFVERQFGNRIATPELAHEVATATELAMRPWFREHGEPDGQGGYRLRMVLDDEMSIAVPCKRPHVGIDLDRGRLYLDLWGIGDLADDEDIDYVED